MNDAHRRRVYGDLIDAIAKRCADHDDPARVREDVERMERLASGDELLRRKYHDRLFALRGEEIDDASLAFLSLRIEELGLALPRNKVISPVSRSNGVAAPPSPVRPAALGELSEIAGLVGPNTLSVMEGLFEPAALIRERGSGANWIALPPDHASTLFGLIDPIDGRYRADIATTQAWIGRLPFYSTTMIVRVIDPTWLERDLVVYYLIDEKGKLYRLNGQSPPIHDVNSSGPIDLTAANVVDYLRFFCFFVHGDEGCFYIAESMNDPMLPIAPDQSTQQTLASAVRPVELGEVNDDGQFLVTATVFYGNALFTGHFNVNRSGMIEMVDDTPLAGDLTVRVINQLK